jgi:hypothetical protein
MKLVKCYDVLLLDSTYGNKVFNFPMLSAMGMSNIYGDHFEAGKGRSVMNFQIALAWMADETQASHEWFLETLKNLV